MWQMQMQFLVLLLACVVIFISHWFFREPQVNTNSDDVLSDQYYDDLKQFTNYIIVKYNSQLDHISDDSPLMDEYNVELNQFNVYMKDKYKKQLTSHLNTHLLVKWTIILNQQKKELERANLNRKIIDDHLKKEKMLFDDQRDYIASYDYNYIVPHIQDYQNQKEVETKAEELLQKLQKFTEEMIATQVKEQNDQLVMDHQDQDNTELLQIVLTQQALINRTYEQLVQEYQQARQDN